MMMCTSSTPWSASISHTISSTSCRTSGVRMIGSGIAGLGGALLARYVGYISPESFATHVSIAFIIILVVGGRASIFGPLIGAIIMTPLPELFRGAVQSQNIFYGVSLILILKFLPQGIASLAMRRGRGAEAD